MPPPNYHHKISARSAGDHEPENENCECNSKTDFSNSDDSSTEDDPKFKHKKKSVGIVKSLLGPSLEDAVLRTLEFGKFLIHKPEETETPKEKKGRRNLRKEIKDNWKQQTATSIWDREGLTDCLNYTEGRSTRKRIVFTAKLDKDIPLPSSNSSGKKPNSVSKIRSLDSDLKHGVSSPENIKKQLEALVQINKDEPPEHAGTWNSLQKNMKPIELTVMPSVCTYRNEADVSCSQPCDSRSIRRSCEAEQSSSRMRTSSERTSRRRLGAGSGICQAPEFLSNALGPSLDVSLFDNIKMVKDLLQGDSGKGEGCMTPKPCLVDSFVKREEQVQIKMCQDQPNEFDCKISDLQRIVVELEQKETSLRQQIEEEEKERECKRKAFEEEEKKLCSMKSYLEGLAEEEKQKDCGKQKLGTDSKDFDAKYESLKQRIACEEEKLSRLKDQYDYYKREIMEVSSRKETLKRNKSLLDAWDVIASRVCHTRLPSFSRACDLERKQLKCSENLGSIHCCFLSQEPSGPSPFCPSDRKTRSRSQCGSRNDTRCSSGCMRGPPACGSNSRDHDSNWKCHRQRPEEIPFPIQRDVICGMHQVLKTCSCGEGARNEGLTSSSDDELLKKSGMGMGMRDKMKGDCSYCGSVGGVEKICGKPPIGKGACRSRSETAMRRDKCAKIVKVMWAVTRINIFQDNCRTYEVMDATSTPPPCVPAKTEGIFVVKNPQKKTCAATTPKKKGSYIVSGV